MQPEQEPILINMRKAAVLLAISEPTLRKWMKAKNIPFKRFGRAVRFSPDALREWAKAMPAESGE
jgi:excisionase family DNA binding protein